VIFKYLLFDVVTAILRMRPSPLCQSSSQRDFVVLAMRTPQKDTEGLGSYSYNVGFLKVSRMLQGGFSVFGIFLVTPPELPKEAQNTLRQLSMTQTKHISNPGNTTSLNFILIGDFRAKPADWKYQWWGCTSWPMFTCSVKLDLLFPVLEMHVLPQDMEKCVKEELQTWAKQIEDGLCLINGKTMPDEQTFRAQIIILLLVLPRRVFASLPGMGLCVCDYMRDECVDMPENNIGTSQEALLAPTIDLEKMIFQKYLKAKSTVAAPPKTPSEDPTEDPKTYKMYTT
uniref:Protein odr-4 homolog n=1 Tax=Oncorhynchus kisutch TaxID=8019 RepID=A0A8C7LS53_ONCKI